jgi:hypothetical protein
MVQLRWYSVRLQIVSAALFAGGLVSRLVLDWQNETAWSYPSAIEFQTYWYGAGLLAFLLWIIDPAKTARQRGIGCATWVGLALASAWLILSSDPK